jgi:hypothetical protein
MKAYLSNLFKKLLAKFFTPHTDPTAPPTVVAVMQETTQVDKEVHTSDFQPIGPPGYSFDRQWNQWRDVRGQLIGVGADPYVHAFAIQKRDENLKQWQIDQNAIRYTGPFDAASVLSNDDQCAYLWQMHTKWKSAMGANDNADIWEKALSGDHTALARVVNRGELVKITNIAADDPLKVWVEAQLAKTK